MWSFSVFIVALFLLVILVPVLFAAPNAASFVREQHALGKRANGLISEKSPYLLQHAFNPVNWLPWGEEAFLLAEQQNKPIFLSIGYSTCHWCHVMAHESFENGAVARYLNAHFICIKVDREERPDIDRIYMAATRAMTGGGGWPMSVFLQPDRLPFYAGTYFPPQGSHGRPGFLDLLTAINKGWLEDPSRIKKSAVQMEKYLHGLAGAKDAQTLDAAVFATAFEQMHATYDRQYGGFGTAPKFPRPVVFNFLLRYHHRTGNRQALQMTVESLRHMADGGMYDVLGGGFHRYSVDAQWRIPHFEKMLYDQAQLAFSYFEAFQLTAEVDFLQVGREILDYVLADLTDVHGGFYSAEDADSQDPDLPAQHREGAFYSWTSDEIFSVLGVEAGALFSYRYGVKEGGNALDDPMQEFTGKNIFFSHYSIDETAEKYGKSRQEVVATLAECREKLYQVRLNRPRPHLDDKVICAWNGLMISAFAKGYQVTGDSRYLAAAVKAADFIVTTLYDAQTQTLLRRYRQGEAALPAQLDDYAFFTQGLIDLYEASFDTGYLQWALRLTEKQLELFSDEAGGFFETSGLDSSLLVRMKEEYDGAEPAANSVAVMNLLRLAPFGQEAWQERAKEAVHSFSAAINHYPAALPQMLAAYDFYVDKPRQVVIVGDRKADDTIKMVSALHSLYLPNTLLLLVDDDSVRFLADTMPFVKSVQPRNGTATAYICEDFTCSLPTTDVGAMVARLQKNRRN